MSGFAEDVMPFYADFWVDATLNGVAVHGAASGGSLEPIAGRFLGEGTFFDGPASDLGAAADGDDLVIADGPFAGAYKVRENKLDESRLVAVLKLERQ